MLRKLNTTAGVDFTESHIKPFPDFAPPDDDSSTPRTSSCAMTPPHPTPSDNANISVFEDSGVRPEDDDSDVVRPVHSVHDNLPNDMASVASGAFGTATLASIFDEGRAPVHYIPELVRYTQTSQMESTPRDDAMSELRTIFTSYSVKTRAQDRILHFIKNCPVDVLRSLPCNHMTLRLPTLPHVRYPLPPGEMIYFGIEQLLHLPKVTLFNPNANVIRLSVSIDGVPIFRDANGVGFWPIHGSVGDYPTFVIGFYSGVSKPLCPNAFMRPLVAEVQNLETHGMYGRHAITPLCRNDNRDRHCTSYEHSVPVYRFRLHSLILDAPALSYIMCIVGHQGKHGCPKCKDPGTSGIGNPVDGLTNAKMNRILRFGRTKATKVPSSRTKATKVPSGHTKVTKVSSGCTKATKVPSVCVKKAGVRTVRAAAKATRGIRYTSDETFASREHRDFVLCMKYFVRNELHKIDGGRAITDCCKTYSDVRDYFKVGGATPDPLFQNVFPQFWEQDSVVDDESESHEDSDSDEECVVNSVFMEALKKHHYQKFCKSREKKGNLYHVSILCTLRHFDMVKDVVIDYMHQLLGVVHAFLKRITSVATVKLKKVQQYRVSH